MIEKSLNPDGTAYIIIPSERHFAVNFLHFVDYKNKFTYEKVELDDIKYFSTPLKNEITGFKTYPGLKELRFYVYIFKKKL